MRLVIGTVLTIMGFILSACIEPAEPVFSCPSPADAPGVPVEQAALNVVEALKAEDVDTLSDLIHPERGVRFSPHAFVDVERDRVAAADEIQALWASDEVLTWGYGDATGDPIDLTFEDYYRRFVFDRDFSRSTDIGCDRAVTRGNLRNNAGDVYPNATIVEFHLPGEDPAGTDGSGLDWRSLRLAFEPFEDRWSLVGIMHAAWTT